MLKNLKAENAQLLVTMVPMRAQFIKFLRNCQRLCTLRSKKMEV